MQWIDNLTATQQFVLFSTLKIVGVFSVLMFIVAYSVMIERKVSAFIQDRHGPNRVGPWGLLQPLADAVKAFLKEDYTPGHVRKVYFWLAPAIVMIPSLLTVAVIPFGSTLGGRRSSVSLMSSSPGCRARGSGRAGRSGPCHPRRRRSIAAGCRLPAVTPERW